MDLNNVIDKKIIDDILEFCELNSIDYKEFINSSLDKAIVIEKYGEIPSFFNKKKENKMINTYIVNIELSEKNLVKTNVKHRKISSK